MESTRRLGMAVGLGLGASVLAAEAAGRTARGLPRWGLARLLDLVVPMAMARIDLVRLAEEFLGAVDLPEIVRRNRSVQDLVLLTAVVYDWPR